VVLFCISVFMIHIKIQLCMISTYSANIICNCFQAISHNCKPVLFSSRKIGFHTNFVLPSNLNAVRNCITGIVKQTKLEPYFSVVDRLLTMAFSNTNAFFHSLNLHFFSYQRKYEPSSYTVYSIDR
jgi:hypothetical protein